MSATDLADCSASELLALYAAKRASPVEAMQAVLARVERLNPVLNAFCLVDGPAALASARDSEARWQAGHPIGALDGVPVSIKDLILTKGWPTRRGSATVDAHQAWDTDAPATARLREAGAVLFGKTCTPEFGCKGETNSPLTGITRNPWNPRRTPGGSSGGTAAAVAAGMGPLSVGTDGAGSVRIPAAFCGNFGLKPSFGRVPAYPLSPFGSVAHLGPHSMNVRDAALMMNVLKRPDARDWTSLPPDDADYLHRLDDGIRGLRIAFSPTLAYANVHPEVAAAVAAAAKQLASLGAIVEAVDPGFEDPLEITTGLWFVGAWTLWNTLTPQQQAVTDPDFRAEAELGAAYSALEVNRLNLRRGALGSQMRQFMQRFDLLVTPTVALPAFEARAAGHSPMDPKAMLQRVLEFLGVDAS
ncbi:MAG: amidase, partial [Burkholderiales bacterium]|nr:amidase [Burkholderiales bacterium]